jgi:hypothetical protein
MDTGDPPFPAQNRPWLTSDCIDAMNEEYVACMLNVPPESREASKEWAAVKVEMRTCHDRPDVRARCEAMARGLSARRCGGSRPRVRL